MRLRVRLCERARARSKAEAAGLERLRAKPETRADSRRAVHLGSLSFAGPVRGRRDNHCISISAHDLLARAGKCPGPKTESPPSAFLPPFAPPRRRQCRLVRLGHPRHHRQPSLVLDVRETVVQDAQVLEEQVRRPQRVHGGSRLRVERRGEPDRERREGR